MVPIALDLSEDLPTQLVVEGSINTEDELFTVSLRTTGSFVGVEENTLGIDAEVEVISEKGEVTHFREIRPGVYRTDSAALIGRVGESYTLRIVLANGESYISSTETIREPVIVSDPRAELSVVRGLSDELIPFVNYSHKIHVSLENTDKDHFVRVVTGGWSRVQVAYGLCGGFDGTGGPAGAAVCWASRRPVSPQINTATNQGLSGTQYEILADDVPLDFRDKFVADISVLSMSPEAFNYWETAKSQLDQGGGIFDPPFASVVGNIRNVNDDSESVLGYFHAYGKSTIIFCFDRAGTLAPVNVPGIPCEVTCVQFWRPAVFDLPFNQNELCPL